MKPKRKGGSESKGVGELLEGLAKRVMHIEVSVNPHLMYYQTALEYLSEAGEIDDVERSTKDIINETDELVLIRVYPDNPVGFYCVVDTSLKAALSRADKLISEEERERKNTETSRFWGNEAGFLRRFERAQ